MKRTRAFVGGALVLWTLGLGAASAVDLGDGIVHLRVGAYDVDTPPARAAAPLPREPCAWVVAFTGPADRAIADAILERGARILGFVPSNAYLVWADAATARRLAEARGILRVDPYRAEWKVSPELEAVRPRGGEDPLLFVEVWPGRSPREAAERLRAAGIRVVQVIEESGLHRLVVRAGPDAWAVLTADPSVQWIESIPHPSLRNDTVRWIIQSNNPVTMALPLYDHGLFGEGEVVGHIDEPPYMPSCYFLDQTDNTPGPNHRKVVALRRVNLPVSGSHGTHTAGTVCGENVDPGFPQHRGMAPKARLSCSSYYDLHGVELDSTASNLATFLALAHADGARVHTNSWGDDSRFDYTSWCVDIDTFSRQYEDDLVLFAVTDLATLRTPENAKNCLAVGASYSNPNQAQFFLGGMGPTNDGRRKPEVFAPGANTRSSDVGACATSFKNGTSMAAPAVAGGAALIREYFRRGFYPTGAPWPANARIPSGALLKAMVINSTVDMTGVTGYPSNVEGWGRILLDEALFFPGDTRGLRVRDVRHAQGLSTGEVDTFRFRVTGSAEPLKITLAFMDQPAALGAGLAPVNDLDLEVQGPAGLYRGNVIDVLAGQSTTGGSTDPLNDVERVLISAPTPGEWTVRVRGASVPMGPQGYAVVVNGALAARDLVTHPEPDPPGASAERAMSAESLVLDTVTPNPFRTSTTIRFGISAGADVSVDVYDLRGRRVRELLARTVEPGEQKLTWDGRDDAGSRVAAGIYFVRLRAGGAERIVKTALLR